MGPGWIFFASYPIAFFSLSLALVLLFLFGSALWRTRLRDTGLFDFRDLPIKRREIPRAWATGFGIFVLAALATIGYGFYSFSHLQPMLSEFPLGYVVMDTDLVTGAVTPYEMRRGLESYEFDFRPVHVVENTATHVSMQLPDVLKDGKTLLSGAIIGGDKRSMATWNSGAMFGDGDTQVFVLGRALAFRDKRLLWVVGFQRLHLKLPGS